MIAITTNNSIKVKAPNAPVEFFPYRIIAACQNGGMFAKHFFRPATNGSVSKNAGQKREGKIKSQAHESISQTVIVEYWLGDCIISGGLFSFAVFVGFCV
jgi:hypothetical protein